MQDEITKQKLAETLKKEPAALSPSDIEFLRARRSYLTPVQLDYYAEFLDPQYDAPEEVEGPTPRPKRKDK